MENLESDRADPRQAKRAARGIQGRRRAGRLSLSVRAARDPQTHCVRITHMTAEKSRVGKHLPIVKVDPSKRLAYGWASVVQRDGQDVVDLQGDVIALADLEHAAHGFMAR